MGTLPTLPINDLISVSVILSQAAAQAQNTSTLLVLADVPQIDVVSRLREYGELTDVGTALGTNNSIYAAAQDWFGQDPKPTSFFAGRWAETASHGQLYGAPLTLAQQALSNFTGIADGGFGINIDNAGVVQINGMDFSAAASLNGIAAIIQTALATHTPGTTCIWSAELSRFIITSPTTGAASSISFMTAGTGVGVVDISGLLHGLATSSGAYVAGGIVAESALQAAQIFDDRFGQKWYALQIPDAADADHLAVGTFVQTTATRHFYGTVSGEAGILDATITNDLFSEMSALKLTKSAGQYSSSSKTAIASALARILTTDWNANKSAINLMYKQEPTIAAEYLTRTQVKALQAKNGNVFVNYNNGTAIFQPGTTFSPLQFMDTVIGTDVMAVDLLTALYNLLYTSPTKVPQDDGGMNQCINTASSVMEKYRTNGLLAPGIWTFQGFGSLKQGDYLDKGYYIYAAPVATQLEASRAARMAMPLQIAVKLAGAIQTIAATITVNP